MSTPSAAFEPSIAPSRTAVESDPQVWDRRTLLARRSWRMRVPRDVAREFADLCAGAGVPADAAEFHWDPRTLPCLARFAQRVRAVLIEGEGVTWIQGLDRVRRDDGRPLTPAERASFYVALGSAMGRPMTEYGVLYAVRDRGVDFTTTALPVSMTNAETAFHTDSSSVDSLPDLVGLLCETPSDNGGESLVSNALLAYRQLHDRSPNHCRILEREFVRDVVTPGKEKTIENVLRNRFPIFGPSNRREGVCFRYMRYWIERGQASIGQPLDAESRAALDALDRTLASPANAVSFRLGTGDILWVNNRTVAHNRTAYRDTETNSRLLHRMWIRLNGR